MVKYLNVPQKIIGKIETFPSASRQNLLVLDAK